VHQFHIKRTFKSSGDTLYRSSLTSSSSRRVESETSVEDWLTVPVSPVDIFLYTTSHSRLNQNLFFLMGGGGERFLPGRFSYSNRKILSPRYFYRGHRPVPLPPTPPGIDVTGITRRYQLLTLTIYSWCIIITILSSYHGIFKRKYQFVLWFYTYNN